MADAVDAEGNIIQPRQSSFAFDIQQGTGDNIVDPEEPNIIEPRELQDSLNSYQTAMANFREYLATTGQESGRNFNRLKNAAITAAEVFKDRWTENPDQDLIDQLPEGHELITIDFSGLGPQSEDPPTIPQIDVSGDLDTNIDGAERHAWVTSRGLRPILHPDKLDWLQRAGRLKKPPEEIGEDGEEFYQGIWVLGENEEPPEGFIPAFSSSMSPYPKNMQGINDDNYLMPNDDAGRLGYNLRDLLSLNLDSDVWKERIQAELDVDGSEFEDANDVIESFIGPGINIYQTNGEAQFQFSERGRNEDGSPKGVPVYRKTYLHNDFFESLLRPLIANEHPEKWTMNVGTSPQRGRSGPPNDIMAAITEELENSGIMNDPAPHSSLAQAGPRTGAGGGYAATGETALGASNFSTPMGIAKFAQELASRKINMLYDIAQDAAIKEALFNADPEFEMPPPITDEILSEEGEIPDEIIQMYSDLETAMGPNVTNMLGSPSAHNTRVPEKDADGKPTGKWVTSNEVLSYGALLDNLSGFIDRLKKLYVAGYNARGDYNMPAWEDAIGGYTQSIDRVANVSGNPMSKKVFEHLQGMGLIPPDDQWSKNYNLPQDLLDINGGPLPTTGYPLVTGTEGNGIFTTYGSVKNPNMLALQQAKVRNNFLQIFTDLADNDPEKYGPDTQMGKYMTSFHEGNVPTDPQAAKDHNNNVFFGFQHKDAPPSPPDGKDPEDVGITGETGQTGGKTMSDSEDPIERMIRELVEAQYGTTDPTIGTPYGTGEEGGDDDLDPDKQAYIDEMRHLANVDYNEFKDEWKNHYSRPLREKRRAGKTIGTTAYGHADINGEERQKALNSIRSNYKEIHGLDINEQTLENLSSADLNDRQQKMHEEVDKVRLERFAKEANDVSHLTPLSPQEGQNKHALLQQYRKLYHHGQKYGDKLDDKDQGTPGTAGYKPSAKTQLNELIRQIWNPDGVSGLAQAMGIPIEFFTEDKQKYDESFPNAGDAPYAYGDAEHIKESNAKNDERVNQYSQFVNYIQNPNEGGALDEHIHENNGGAKDFTTVGVDGQVVRYGLNDPGSRMTYHKGPNKGQLISNTDDYEGVTMAYNTEPEITYQKSPHKIFGMSEELENAYTSAYKSTADLKQIAQIYGTVASNLSQHPEGLIPPFLEDGTPNPLYTEGPLMMDSASGVTVDDIVNYVAPILANTDEARVPIISGLILHFRDQGIEYTPEDINEMVERDSQLVNDLPNQIQEHQDVLQNALATGEITQKTLDTLNRHINYSDYDAKQDMMAEGHNNLGLPIDENGDVEEPPTYIGGDGQEHPRVYHRATKMWYNPEMLDDLRNSHGLGTYLNNPYDFISPVGTRMGQDGNGKPNYQYEKDPDMYRLGVPSVNNTTFADPQAYHGILIKRDGVYMIGSKGDTDPPTIENGEIINHGGENGDMPFSSDEIAKKTFQLQRINSEQNNPTAFLDEQNNPVNMINIDSEGHFDGGWKEWYQDGRLKFSEMPGVRSLPGMKRFTEVVSGLPQERIPPIKSTEPFWRGPQTWSGNQTLKPNEPQPRMSALQALRQFGSLDVPERQNASRPSPQGGRQDIFGRRPGEKRTALRAMWDAINMSIPPSIANRPLGPLHQDTMINEWQDGQSEEQQRRTQFAEDFRHMTSRMKEINPSTGKPYLEGDIDQQTQDYLEAENIVQQTQGDPRTRPIVQQQTQRPDQFDQNTGNQPNIPV